jgi:hypothetical protein
MRKATKTVATWLGVVAGIAGSNTAILRLYRATLPHQVWLFPPGGRPVCRRKSGTPVNRP